MGQNSEELKAKLADVFVKFRLDPSCVHKVQVSESVLMMNGTIFRTFLQYSRLQWVQKDVIHLGFSEILI